MSMALEDKRKWYAEEVRWNAALVDENIVRAFSIVPREKFLGPGPWKLKPPGTGYIDTPTSNPEHLYHNVQVAIDAQRGLNNGLPTGIARILQHGAPKVGEQVAHVGAGVGYYSAILAEVVGTCGSVLALEVDTELATRAEENLADWSHVSCICADGGTYQFETSSLDVLFINAGATHLQYSWITSLKNRGRLIVPLTYAPDELGQLIRITRLENRYEAQCVQETYMYPCIGSREDQQAGLLREAVKSHGWVLKGELRLDPENADDSAWVKSDRYWISVNGI